MVDFPTLQLSELDEKAYSDLWKHDVVVLSGLDPQSVEDLYACMHSVLTPQYAQNVEPGYESELREYSNAYIVHGLYDEFEGVERIVLDAKIGFRRPPWFEALKAVSPTIPDVIVQPVEYMATLFRELGELFDGSGCDTLRATRYLCETQSEYGIVQAHEDNFAFVALQPIGAPLEVQINGEYHPVPLETSQMVWVSPGISHRVLSNPSPDRYSIIIS